MALIVSNAVSQLNARSVIDFIISESRKGTHSIGFLPRCTIERYRDRGWISICHDGNEFVGFLVSGRHRKQWAIYQLWTVNDARRIGVAQRLVMDLEAVARSCGVNSVRARVAVDLESNLFWDAMDYQIKETVPGGRFRNRMIHSRLKIFTPITGVLSVDAVSLRSVLQTLTKPMKRLDLATYTTDK